MTKGRPLTFQGVKFAPWMNNSPTVDVNASSIQSV